MQGSLSLSSPVKVKEKIALMNKRRGGYVSLDLDLI